MPTSTGVFITKTNLMPRWKPQSWLGISWIGFSVEPRGVGSTSGLVDISLNQTVRIWEIPKSLEIFYICKDTSSQAKALVWFSTLIQTIVSNYVCLKIKWIFFECYFKPIQYINILISGRISVSIAKTSKTNRILDWMLLIISIESTGTLGISYDLLGHS